MDRAGLDGQAMSYQSVQAVLSTTGSKANARCVLIALAYHADEAGACWPSIDTIAKEANVCRRTAQAMLAELEAANEIVVDRNAGPRGVNVYRITCCTAQLLHGADDAPPVQHAAPVQAVAPVQTAAHKKSYSSFRSKDLQEGATRKRTQRPKAPPNPLTHELTQALAEWQGYTTCNWAAEGKAAKRIADGGYTLADTRKVWRRMKAEDFWRDRHLSLASVYPQLGAQLGRAGKRRVAREVLPMGVSSSEVTP